MLQTGDVILAYDSKPLDFAEAAKMLPLSPGDRGSGTECVSADEYGVASIRYEIRIEDPVWAPAQSSAIRSATPR